MKKEKKHGGGAPKQKEKKDVYQPKDFIPSNVVDTLVPQLPIKTPVAQNFDSYQGNVIPNKSLVEWENKTMEEINRETEELDPKTQEENPNLFYDEDHIIISSNLPLSLIRLNDNNIEWVRPNVYILNYYLDHQIQSLYPKKNYIATRESMKQYHIKVQRENAKKEQDKEKNNLEGEEEEEEDIDLFLKNDEEMRRQNMYKDLLAILTKDYDYKVVGYEKVIETDQEYLERKEREEQAKNPKKKKELKKANPPGGGGGGKKSEQSEVGGGIVIDEADKKVTIVPKPNNIYLKNFLNDESLHNSFYGWYSSVFQLIIDLKIPDMETGQNIFCNIYPQRDGIPIYNPKGKYIVKLYQRGKPRKVVIDDRIPCNRNFEYILPQCTEIEELWPALFFKALLKLNVYKIRHPGYYFGEEFMDTSIIYALTGMQVITMDLNPKLVELLKKKFSLMSDDVYRSKKEKKYIAVYNKKKTKEMNLNKNKYYYDLQNEYDFRNQCNGNYINNLSLQGKKIVQMKRGEKIILKARERSNSIVDKDPNKNLANKNKLSMIERTGDKTTFIDDGQTKDLNDKTKIIKDSEKEKDKNKESNKEKDPNSNTNEKEGKDKDNKFDKTIGGKSAKKYRRPGYKKQTVVSKEVPTPSGETKKKTRSTALIDENNLLINYLYAIDDYFCNDTFNMRRLNVLDFSDLQKDLNDKKVEFKRLPVDQKRQYLIARKKLKSAKIEEKNKRIQSLKDAGDTYNLVRLVNQSISLPTVKYFQEYSANNIELAKKCLLNRWEFPPPETFDKEFNFVEEEQRKLKKLQNMEEKVIPEKTKKEKKEKPIGLFVWTRDMYEDLIGGKEVLKIYQENNKTPRTSNIKEGGWMEFDDICKKFNKLLIIQNTKFCYKENLFVDNTWYNYKTDEFHPSEDNQVFLLVKNPIEDILNGDFDEGVGGAGGIGGLLGGGKKEKKNKKKDKDKEKNKKGEEDKSDSENSIFSVFNTNVTSCTVLIIFEPFTEEFKLNKPIPEVFYPYISFDLVEKDTNIIVQKNIILNEFYSVFYFPYLEKEKEYFIRINGGMTQYGYNLQLFSDFFKIQHISMNIFLKYFLQFQEFNVIAETSKSLEKKRNFMLSKISFIVPDPNVSKKIRFKIDVKHDYYFLKKYINVFLVKDEPFYKKQIDTEKIFSFDARMHQKKIGQCKTDDEYYFVFYIKPEIDLPETEFNISILYNEPNLIFKEIDNLEPFELMDIYYKNKDAILFSYFIYPSDKIYTSMDIKFCHMKLKGSAAAAMPQAGTGGITGGTKPINLNINQDNCDIFPLTSEENHHIKLELYQLTKEPSLEFIDNALKFSYSNQGELVRQWKFSNSLSISNFIFIGDLLSDLKKKKPPAAGGGEKKETKKKETGTLVSGGGGTITDDDESIKKLYPYVLLCYIDVQKLSDLKIPDDFGYIIRIYPSNSIGFIKDRTKEEHEKKLKEKWEENDEGRSELAVKSRKKYLLYAKSAKKEKLNENELKFLQEERQRRTANEIDHIVEDFDSKNNKSKNIPNSKSVKKPVDLRQADKKPQKGTQGTSATNGKGGVAGQEGEEEYFGNLASKSMFNHLNKKLRPLSMENIFRQIKPMVQRDTRAKYILNFFDYSNKNRTVYVAQKKSKFSSILKKREKNFIIADEKYRERAKERILQKFEESENDRKQKNEIFDKTTHDLSENVPGYNRSLSVLRRSQSIKEMDLLDKRKDLQNLIKRRLDIKKDLKTGIEEYKKLLLGNKEDLNKKDKKKDSNQGGINYEDCARLYKDGLQLLGEKDVDVKGFFDVVSSVKEEEVKNEYERLKSGNDKYKDVLIMKIIEDIENNKWKIDEQLIEKLKQEVPAV